MYVYETPITTTIATVTDRKRIVTHRRTAKRIVTCCVVGTVTFYSTFFSVLFVLSLFFSSFSRVFDSLVLPSFQCIDATASERLKPNKAHTHIENRHWTKWDFCFFLALTLSISIYLLVSLSLLHILPLYFATLWRAGLVWRVFTYCDDGFLKRHLQIEKKKTRSLLLFFFLFLCILIFGIEVFVIFLIDLMFWGWSNQICKDACVHFLSESYLPNKNAFHFFFWLCLAIHSKLFVVKRCVKKTVVQKRFLNDFEWLQPMSANFNEHRPTIFVNEWSEQFYEWNKSLIFFVRLIWVLPKLYCTFSSSVYYESVASSDYLKSHALSQFMKSFVQLKGSFLSVLFFSSYFPFDYPNRHHIYNNNKNNTHRP